MRNAGLEWFEYMQHTASAYRTPLSITFAEVATHNHFVFDRGGKVFKQTAPVIKLPAAATEDDHLDLIGLLNSSALEFWVKAVMQDKAGSGIGRGIQAEDWMSRYQRDATKLQSAPVTTNDRPARVALTAALISTAQSRAACLPAAQLAASAWTPSLPALLTQARLDYVRLTHVMVALQEELDWLTYGSYKLIDPVETVPPDAIEPLAPATAPSRSSSPAPTTRPIPTRSPPGGRATATTG
jgi:hypothetical protein